MKKPRVPRDLLDPVVAHFRPQRVILFSSRARGDARRDSDIDLLVIVDDDTSEEKLGWKAGHQAHRSRHAADVFPMRAQPFERDRAIANTLAAEADADGIIVYGSTKGPCMKAPDPRARWEAVNRRLALAEVDRNAAHTLLAVPSLRPSVPFHCQQALEKLLKGFLTLAGKRGGKTRALDRLGAAVAKSFPEIEELAAAAKNWSDWAVVYLYPSEKAPLVPDEKELRRALAVIEFHNVVDAVRCAVEIQRGMAERNADVPAAQRIELRIGVNLDDGDIFGDGVNIAARLEGLASSAVGMLRRLSRRSALTERSLCRMSFAFRFRRGGRRRAKRLGVSRPEAGGQLIVWPGIGNMEKRAPPRYRGIDCEDSLGKGRQHTVLDPLLDQPALGAVPPPEQQGARLKLQNGDAGQEHVRRRYAVGPCRHLGIGPVWPAELRHHIGVEQEHHPSSSGCGGASPSRGGSNATSSLSGCDSNARMPGPWAARCW